jgi:hypothetical protein
MCWAEKVQKTKLVTAKMVNSEKQVAPKLTWNIRPIPMLSSTKIDISEIGLDMLKDTK